MWRPVPDFSSYEASDEGFIRNVNSGHILKNSIHRDGTGMPLVSLVRNNRIHTVETRFVIACTFLGVDFWAKPRPKLEYIDGDKFNNAVTNIRIKDCTDLPGEEWRPVRDWEDTYEVSNLGRVRRQKRVETYVRKDTGTLTERIVAPLIMKQILDTDGEYFTVGLIDGTRTSYPTIHRLVAQAFISNPDNLPMVNHIDGNKKNNHVTNLEWCTAAENVDHAIRTGLRVARKGIDKSAKKVICVETGQIYKNAKAASEQTGIPYNYLLDCMHKCRACHGMHFNQLLVDRRIKCIDTGKIYNSSAEVNDELGLNPHDAIKNHSCTHGLTFCYMRDLPEDEEAYLWECRNRYSQWDRAEKIWEETNGSTQ